MIRFLFLILSISIFIGCQGEPTVNNMEPQAPKFDWQGHRGARGLQPENTLQSFLTALNLGVKTLEMDVVISRDKRVVVSHEPWMNEKICQDNRGNDFSDGKAHNLYQMDYAIIKSFDCGSKKNDRFPDQAKAKAYKPLMENVIRIADNFSKSKGLWQPFYNIEIKSRPEWVGVFCPKPDEYVDLVLNALKGLSVENRVTLQSFDTNILEELNKKKGAFETAYLIENQNSFDENLKKLTFIPDIYSPYYLLVTEDLVKQVKEKGMKLVPWTVNDEAAMRKLIDLGVDGIITDYPNKIKLFEK